MAHYVLDSYALLAYFRNEEGAEKVEQLLNDAAADKHELYFTCINAGEVYYMSLRKDGPAKAESVWKAMKQFPIHIIDADLEFTLAAAKLKAKYPISYADAFAAALTIKRKATLVTGDDEFNALGGEPGFRVKYLLPVNDSETKLQQIICNAIKQRKALWFYYESDSGNYWRKVDPYILAIKDNGKGNLFFTGYVHASNKRKSEAGKDSQGHYLLNKIDLNKFEVSDETFNELKLPYNKILGNLPTIEIICRVVF